MTLAVTLIVSGTANAADIINLTQQTKSHSSFAQKSTRPSASPITHSPQVKLDAKISYQVVGQVKLNNGKIKYRLQQLYDGLPVYNYTIVSEKKSFSNIIDAPVYGSAVSNFAQTDNFTQPSISQTKALAISTASHLSNSDQKNTISNKQAKLWVYMVGNQPHLVYITSFLNHQVDQVSRPFTIIDAHSGKVLKKWDGMTHALIGTGQGGNPNTGLYNYGDDKAHPKLDLTVNNTSSGKECVFNTPHVRTVDLHHTEFKEDPDTGKLIDDPTEKYNSQPVTYDCSNGMAYQEPEINGGYGVTDDAHHFGTVIYNMYNDWYQQPPLLEHIYFRRTKDHQLLMRVHYGENYNNAFWDGQEMNFGDGGPNKVRIKHTSRFKTIDDFYPFVTLDITAHEVSHGFTQLNSRLQGGHSTVPGTACQACSINEAFSDMAGVTAKNYAYGTEDFQIGAEIIKNPNKFGSNSIRSLSDPASDGYTLDNEDQYQPMIDDSIQNKSEVDEHRAAGIYGKAFYELATTRGWSIRKAFEVFVNANKLYWHPDATFDSAACGVIHAADDQDYNTADVEAAFDSVGVNYSQCDVL